MVKVPRSRNAPCPCGSDRRYKHCHGAAGSSPLSDTSSPLEAARVLLAQGKLKETVDACEKLVLTAGEDVATLRVLGNAVVLLGDVEQINNTWLALLKAIPDDPEALFHLGSQAHLRGDTDEAIAFFERALVQAPTHTALLNNLGLALESAGRFVDAEGQFRKAYETTPDAFETMANLAQNLFQQKQFKGALVWFERLDSKFDIVDATIWANRAVCQHSLHDDEGACLSFARALQFEKASAELYLEFGVVNRELKRFDIATEALNQCLSIDPENANARIELFYCHQYMADWKDFEKNRNRLLDIAASSKELSEALIEPFFFMAICDDPVLQNNVSCAWMKNKISERHG